MECYSDMLILIVSHCILFIENIKLSKYEFEAQNYYYDYEMILCMFEFEILLLF